MLSSVMVTFDESNEKHVRTVLMELRKTQFANIQSIIIGQFFGKKSASILLPENEVQTVFNKLVANDISIFPFNEEYRERIKETIRNVKGSDLYVQDKLRVIQNRREELSRSRTNNSGFYVSTSSTVILPVEEKEKPSLLKKAKNDPEPQKENLKSEKTLKIDNVESLIASGNYAGLRNHIKRNPLQSHSLKEKMLPTVKNCITLNYEKGLKDKSYLDTAIKNLKELICDPEIKSISSEDIISTAGNTLLALCSVCDTDEMINLVNMPKVGHKINIMASIKLAEMIFENENGERINFELLEVVAKNLNIRHLLNAFDVMAPVISDVNKSKFDMLISAIENYKNSKGN